MKLLTSENIFLQLALFIDGRSFVRFNLVGLWDERVYFLGSFFVFKNREEATSERIETQEMSSTCGDG